MREHLDYYLPIYTLFGLILCLILFGVAIEWISLRIDANTMRQAGYEAKAINFDCMAKYQGRWLTCSAVVNHSVDVHIESNK